MSDPARLTQRDARDAVIDLLGFGLTAPIQDLPMAETEISVPHDRPAKVVLGYSQPSVLYRLVDADGTATRSRHVTGGRLLLPTGKITEEATFSVLARKADRFDVELRTSIRVHVGLDTSLPARVKIDPANGIRALDPSLAEPGRENPRLAPFRVSVTVIVANGQEGVDYTLEAAPAEDARPGRTLSSAAVRGRGHGEVIEITALPLAEEDLVLRVRATSRFGHDESRLLDAGLPLMIRADREPPMKIAAGPIADFGARTRFGLGRSQASVRYRVFARAIRDDEFRPTGLPRDRVGAVPVPDRLIVRVALPELPDDWRPPAGFVAVSREVLGTGRPLELALQPADAGRVLIVQAIKEHAAGEDATIRSEVTLAGAVVQLVRPNPAPDMTVALDADTGSLTVLGGEPGVFYNFRAQADPGGEFRRPAYVHKRDPDDPALNKGIYALAIGVDLAIARASGPTDPEPRGNPAADSSAPPAVETPGLAPGSALHARAV